MGVPFTETVSGTSFTLFTEDGRYRVRDLIQIPLDEFIRQLPELVRVYLEFDDGVIESTGRELMHGRILWELYAEFDDPAVLSHHHVSRNEGYIDPDTDGEILKDILWNTVDQYSQKGMANVIDIPRACDRMYEIADSVDTFVRRYLGKFVVSLTYKDFADIARDPRVAEPQRILDESSSPTATDITNVYSGIANVIEVPNELKSAPLVLGGKSKSIKLPSLNKCVGPNGLVTDVDSWIFYRCPIKSSFIRGLNTLIELAVESRTSAMSIYYQTTAMQESEYLTRRLQEVCASVWRVHRGVDCKTKNYEPFYMPKKVNISDFKGAWFVNPETGEEEMIGGSKPFLFRDQWIQMRSPTTCALPDRYGICERCYGQLAESVMPGDNIGHHAATAIQKKQTQRILSNKHLVASAIADILHLSDMEKQFLRIPPENTSLIYLAPELSGKSVMLGFSQSSAKNLQDIKFVKDLSSISPQTISRLDAISLSVINGDTVQSALTIRTETDARKGFFTKEFLRYIQEMKWLMDADGNYVIDMKDWDVSLPLIELPMVQLSTPAHMFAVRDMLITSAKRKSNGEINHEGYKQAIAKAPSTAVAFSTFYELVSSSLRVNVAHLRIIILALMVESIEDSDYRIPLDKSKGQIASYNDIMYRRDTALAIAYEAHFIHLFQRMESYTLEHRHPHPSNKLLAG